MAKHETAPSIGQIAEVISSIVQMLGKILNTLTGEQLQWLIGHKKQLAKATKEAVESLVGNDNGKVFTSQLPEGHQLARLILGDDYITPKEVATAYGVSYTDEQLEHFFDTLPNTQTILWLHANGYMLIAGPPTEMSLLRIQEIDGRLFSRNILEWCIEGNQTFCRDDKVVAGEWLAIRKNEVPDSSLKKGWSQQQDLLTEDEHVPNAPTISYAVITYFKVRGIYLLRGKYVRTSSVSVDGIHVTVGCFSVSGLNVSDSWGEYDCMCGAIGISSARLLLGKQTT